MMEQHELWQVEVAGNIYETDFAGLTQWIAESSLLPEDKIKCGDRPWVQAKLVPALAPYFGGQAPLASANVATTTQNFAPNFTDAENVSAGDSETAENLIVHEATPANFGGTQPHTSTGFAPFESEPVEKTEVVPPNAPIGQFTGADANGDGKSCNLHPVREAAFACRQCLSLFCSECPRSIARVRICPLCGDMCNTFGGGAPQAKNAANGGERRPFMKSAAPYVDPHFTFEDFKAAWAYPFRFPLGLLVGGVVSSLFGIFAYLGMASAMVGALFPGLMAMLFFMVMAVVIVYGSATRAVNQVAYGNMDETFLPNPEDFSIMGSILQPCFLGLGTCLVSWGPLLLVGLLIFKVISGAAAEMPKQLDPATMQQLQAAANKPDAGFGAKDPLQREIEGNSRASQANAIRRIQELQQTAQAAPFTTVSNPQSNEEMKKQAVAATLKKIMPRLVPLALLAFLTFLWGIFYFPSALTVAGYTESIGSTLNPLVGFSMMRQMGANYFKAFGSYLLLFVISLIVYAVVLVATAPLAAAGLGETPAHFISNMISFYFYLVIACLFGRALYRSHEKIGYSVAK